MGLGTGVPRVWMSGECSVRISVWRPQGGECISGGEFVKVPSVETCKRMKHSEEEIQCLLEFTTQINSVWSSGVLAQEAAEKEYTGARLQ